jgi:hypothetical protein
VKTVGLGLALAALLVCLPSSASAQTRPGVGYDPQARGLLVSRYQLDSLSSSYQSYTIDWSARPDAGGAEGSINLGDPAAVATAERRWGPGTFGPRFKRWEGPGNEVAYVFKEALVWAFEKHPELLGGDTAHRDGVPTAIEFVDAEAVDDRGLWVAYVQSELTGYSEEHRAKVCDAKLPPGDGSYTDPFWGLPFYYHNGYTAPAPVSPQVPSCG